MKKFLFLPFMIMACIMINGCTTDYESDPISKSERASEVKLKILEMAEDYGLNVKVNEKQLEQNVDYINLGSLEKVMKALTRIKGTYRLKAPLDKNKFKAVQQQRWNGGSNRAPTTNKYQYEYATQSIKGNGFDFTCDCTLTWAEKDGELTDIIAECTVSASTLLMGTSSTSINGSVDEEGSLTFNGTVNYQTSSSHAPVTIYFHVSGKYTWDEDTSYITWS